MSKLKFNAGSMLWRVSDIYQETNLDNFLAVRGWYILSRMSTRRLQETH